MAVYAAQIDRMDQGIGRVMKHAQGDRPGGQHAGAVPVRQRRQRRGDPRRTGAARCFPRRRRDGRATGSATMPTVNPGPDDVFQSNGLPWGNASNTPFRLFKHWVHQGGVATPLIAYWPTADCQSVDHRSAGPRHRPDGDLPRRGRHVVSGEVSGIASWCRWRARACCRSCKANSGPATRRSSGSTKATAPSAGANGSWSPSIARPWELYDLDADRTELHDLAAQQPGHGRGDDSAL